MIRAYGNAPYRVALLHGGPGAPGTLAPLARRLSRFGGVLEHLQTQYDLPSLLHNISEVLSPFGPVVVAGHSWGAWLGLWTAALFPAQVHRLILIGSAPLTDAYVPQITQRRLANLSSSKANRMATALAMLENGNSQQRQTAMAALPTLLAQSDAYQTAPEAVMPGDLWPEDEAAYANLWPLAASLRTQGALLQSALSVHCPIDIIHGACDPHPAEGVYTPLQKIGVPFTLHLLSRCGHTPFTERYAQDDFYQLMRMLCFA